MCKCSSARMSPFEMFSLVAIELLHNPAALHDFNHVTLCMPFLQTNTLFFFFKRAFTPFFIALFLSTFLCYIVLIFLGKNMLNIYTNHIYNYFFNWTTFIIIGFAFSHVNLDICLKNRISMIGSFEKSLSEMFFFIYKWKWNLSFVSKSKTSMAKQWL